MESLPETMTEQTAAAYIRSAYEKIGLDLDKISSSYILVTGGKMLALAGAGMAASILVGLIASLVGAGLGRNLRKDVFRKVVDFSNGEFDQFSTASLITRSTNDIQQIQLLDGDDPANGALCADPGGGRHLERLPHECGYVLDHCPCSGADALSQS